MTGQWTAFGPLQTPTDLLGKLRHDLARMEARPEDIYAAFDFFVTAEHMLDWRWPGKADEPTRKAARAAEPDLATVSHLANGAKHYRVELGHHQSVDDVRSVPTAFDPAGFDGGTFQVGTVVIHQPGGTTINAIVLGRRVVAHWSKALGAPPLTPKRGLPGESETSRDCRPTSSRASHPGLRTR